MVRGLEPVGVLLVAVKPADHLRFGDRRDRGRIAFFPVTGAGAAPIRPASFGLRSGVARLAMANTGVRGPGR